MGHLRQAPIRSLPPLRSAARSSLADRRFAKKAPVAVQNSGQVNREDHHRLHSRSTENPKWYCEPVQPFVQTLGEERGMDAPHTRHKSVKVAMIYARKGTLFTNNPAAQVGL